MKNITILTALAALFLVGCGSSEPAASTPEATAKTTPATAPAGGAVTVAYDAGSIKEGDKAHCVVCVAKEGSSAEEAVAETVDYEGKTYAFCSEGEKAEFISNPAKYAKK